ncbi:MAG: hypothetical protein IPN34_22320 [Planctomycetes bacterium]|nr:hypothetical protein [Planctomycetota bacterium]
MCDAEGRPRGVDSDDEVTIDVEVVRGDAADARAEAGEGERHREGAAADDARAVPRVGRALVGE